MEQDPDEPWGDRARAGGVGELEGRVGREPTNFLGPSGPSGSLVGCLLPFSHFTRLGLQWLGVGWKGLWPGRLNPRSRESGLGGRVLGGWGVGWGCSRLRGVGEESSEVEGGGQRAAPWRLLFFLSPPRLRFRGAVGACHGFQTAPLPSAAEKDFQML